MAVGLPLKTTYADGDVYSASDVNDTNGTINLFQTSTLSRSAGKNGVINGGMDIWQRGTSFTIPNGGITYQADRWTTTRYATGSTVTRQTVSDTTNLPTIQYCMRIARDLANASTGIIATNQSFETVNSIPFAGQVVTFSFYARKGANYSATSNILNARLLTGTGTDQSLRNGFTGETAIINQNATLTTTWQRFTYSGTVGATATQIALDFQYTPTGVAGAADYYEITGVQLELGSYATTFSRVGGNYGLELAACQRYYFRNTAASAYAFLASFAWAGSSTVALFTTALPVPMRVAPTALDFSSNINFRRTDGNTYAMTSLTLDASSPYIGSVYSTISGGTANNVGTIASNNSTSSFIGFSAELI
jgi:hypothetical protein